MVAPPSHREHREEMIERQTMESKPAARRLPIPSSLLFLLWVFSVFSVLLWFNSSARAQTSYPMITHTTPVAVQRGQSTEVTVEGQMNFFGTYKALFEGTGISAEIVGDPPAKTPPGQRPQVKSVKLRLTVTPEAPL